MIQDLHSHTYYSYCGKDEPEVLIEKAIDGGVEVLGISDHNYGVGVRGEVFDGDSEISVEEYKSRLSDYYAHITRLKEKYADRINILRGIEIATGRPRPRTLLPDEVCVSYFDYALVEHIYPISTSAISGDLLGFAKRVGCPLGIAHTDLFAFIEEIKEEPLSYLKRMAEMGIFWELNVNYDSIHNYVEHKYVKHFFESKYQQDLIRESGVKISVGFDCHNADEYLPERIKEACARLSKLGIPMMFEENKK